MNTERTIREIRDNPYRVIDAPEDYRVVSAMYKEDFKSGITDLVLIVENQRVHCSKKLHFSNVHLNSPAFTAIRDATGLYFLDTSYLNWSPQQALEVGDTDGGPPLFWCAEVSVE